MCEVRARYWEWKYTSAWREEEEAAMVSPAAGCCSSSWWCVRLFVVARCQGLAGEEEVLAAAV